MQLQLRQEQKQKLQQRQRMSQHQYLHMRLLELSAEELEQRIDEEISANPALEKDFRAEQAPEADSQSPADDSLATSFADAPDAESEEVADSHFEQQREIEDKQDELAKALRDMDDDLDPLDNYYNPDKIDAHEYALRTHASETTFYDLLKEQIAEARTTPLERQLMEYIVASLDDDGYFRRDIDSIVDELTIYEYLDVSAQDVEHALSRVQQFEPAGIAARNLQECLLLQIARRQPNALTHIMRNIVSQQFEQFTSLNWTDIQLALNITESELLAVKHEFRKLNPAPGAALNSSTSSAQTITPDFTVHVDEDNRITITLNQANRPSLTIDADFKHEASDLGRRRSTLTPAELEAYHFSSRYIGRARTFILAMQQRQQTLMGVMGAIVKRQRRFFITGDIKQLRPMVLADLARELHIDISTICRARKNKYVQTDWGTFPLHSLFSERLAPGTDSDVATKTIKLELQEIIDAEDKTSPLSDSQLTALLNKRGYPLARRTTAKYREQLQIPIARFRKQTP